MISIGAPKEGKQVDILCVGAHCDDIEIGCGGTLIKWINEGKIAKILWVVFSSDPKRKAEATSSAKKYLASLGAHEIIVLDFKDAFLNLHAAEVKEYFESLKLRINPDIIFTHYRDDRHQDHRLLSDLTWNTFRNHLIFEYEIPKYDGDLGHPNGFVAIDQGDAMEKVALLLECFESQSGKHWFDQETFLSLMRIRGLECNSPSRYAEAFFIRKCLI